MQTLRGGAEATFTSDCPEVEEVVVVQPFHEQNHTSRKAKSRFQTSYWWNYRRCAKLALMKVNIEHRHYRGREIVEQLICERLARLGQRRRITEAFVRVEETAQQSPPCSALFHLVTPGPDIVVQASDHSLAAAVMKADEQLHGCIDERERKQMRSRKGEFRPLRALPSKSAFAGR